MSYPRLFSRLYNTPLMIAPDKAAAIESVFQTWVSGGGAAWTAEDISAFQADRGITPLAAAIGPQVRFADKPYQMTDSGIAIIPVMGTLVQRAGGMDAMSGLTSYAKIDRMIGQAQSDPDVSAILMEYDTPGGEVSGLFTLVDSLMSARGNKPTWAYVNEGAFSAGYALASTADKIYLPATGRVGSIGAVTMHVDQSKRDATQGYAYTLIQSGDRKTDGNSHQPISDEALAATQAEIHRLRGMFADHVDAARGLKAGAAFDTQAALFNAEEAIGNGLADGFASFREVVAMLESEIAPQSSAVFSTTARHAATTKEAHMSQTEATAAGPAETINPEKFRAEGASAERARIAAILNCDEAKGREAMATVYALETELSADLAKNLLAKSPAVAAQAAAPVNPLHAAMAGVANPKVGADVAEDAAETPEAQAHAMAMSILSAGKPKAASA